MIPYPSTLTYNAGITKFNGKYVMVFRNDYNYTEAEMRATLNGAPWPRMKINLGLAFSDDGVEWKVEPKPFCPHQIQRRDKARLRPAVDGHRWALSYVLSRSTHPTASVAE